MKAAERKKIIAETIQAFGDLVISQRFGDMPGWINADLTVSQLRAVYLLAYHGALTITVLAQQLRLGKPATSTLVQQLVQLGLAERADDAHDRRRTYVHLTDAGTGLVEARREQRGNLAQAWFSRMEDAELLSLRDGLKALLDAMQSVKR